VSNTLQVVYTVSYTVCTVSTTFLGVYTVSNIVYTVSTTVLVMYTIQCSRLWCKTKNTSCLEGHQGEADTHRPLKEDKQPLCLQSTVVVVDIVHPLQVAMGHACPFFFAAGRVIEPQHAEELMEPITKPSSSFSSSVTQAQSSLPSNAAATGSLSTVTPSVAPPSCTEESPELFDHSVGYMLLEDEQRFEGSDVGCQVEEGSNVSLERGVPQKDKKRAVKFPQLQHTAKFAP
ncbi:hypothetical protein AB205_0003680, partial [Aquarana catesbeiana]